MATVGSIGPIKNPLTIIAIFAGIAEISGTVVLPFIAPENQATYIWFLMIFPMLLVIVFFLTLNYNHKVLYAPSDYQNEENFLRSLPQASVAEKVEKIEEELVDTENTASIKQEEGSPIADATDTPEMQDAERPNIRRNTHVYVKAFHNSASAALRLEKRILDVFEKRVAVPIRRDIKLGDFVFDGLYVNDDVATVVEVILPSRGISKFTIDKFIRQVSKARHSLPYRQVVAQIVIAIDVGIERTNVQKLLDNLADVYPVPVKYEIVSVEDFRA